MVAVAAALEWHQIAWGWWLCNIFTSVACLGVPLMDSLHLIKPGGYLPHPGTRAGHTAHRTLRTARTAHRASYTAHCALRTAHRASFTLHTAHRVRRRIPHLPTLALTDLLVGTSPPSTPLPCCACGMIPLLLVLCCCGQAEKRTFVWHG
jgi:hypothetical protein